MNEFDEKEFYYKGKFFENIEELFTFAKEWPFLIADQETFESMWKDIGNEISKNIFLHGIEISNGALNEILRENCLKTFSNIVENYVKEKK